MIANRGYDAYTKSKIMTATPEDLILMLFDGAIKFCNLAIVGVEEGNIEKASNNIIKVQNIITEFRVSLDHKYEVWKDFDIVYQYLEDRLIQANLKKDKEILEEVLEHLRTFRDMWKELILHSRQEKAQ